MKIVEPSISFLWMTENPLQAIELAGRTCYKSEDKITDDSANQFVKMLMDRGHEAMLEHASMSYRVICDRGVTHEIVRHRLFSYAQESTRYVKYDDIEVINPGLTESDLEVFKNLCTESEKAYTELLKSNKPQIARSVLPTCLKTEIVITGNFREWRHFFKLRTARGAHPQMREIANMIAVDACKRVPVVFEQFI